MHIVGTDDPLRDAGHVHTIDIWFSHRRNVWMVERITADGHHIGPTFCAETEADARDCLSEWLRAHSETYLAAHGEPAALGKRAANPRQRAA